MKLPVSIHMLKKLTFCQFFCFIFTQFFRFSAKSVFDLFFYGMAYHL